MRVDAVERCTRRIAEASIETGAERMAEIAPDLPLPGVHQLGNSRSHDYNEVDTRLVHAIVVDRMPGLLAACKSEITKLSP